MGLARRTAAGPAAGRDRVVTTRCSGGELVWVREGGLAARRAQGAHRLRGFAVFRRIRSSRRLAGRAISCSRLLVRLPSGGRSAHVAPVLLVREAWWGIVSWGGRAVTRRYWGAFTCVEADTGFARTSARRTPAPRLSAPRFPRLAPLHQVGYDRRDKESQVYRGVFIIAAHRAFVSGCEGSSIAELRRPQPF